jgi:formylglycine-generating enzyme required for sulfatase activity
MTLLQRDKIKVRLNTRKAGQGQMNLANLSCRHILRFLQKFSPPQNHAVRISLLFTFTGATTMQTLRLKLSALCCAALFPIAAHAGGGGMLRISCDGDAAGAAVTINGKFKGDCPMDMAIGAGSWNLRVVKKVDSDHERVYAETVRIGDDVVKKIDVSLSRPRHKFADQRCAAETKNALPRIATDMVRIPAGSFEMGCQSGRDGSCHSDEKPVHGVNLEAFEIGKFEVTQAQWKAVMGNNPSEFEGCGDSMPVENISWEDIQTFIQKLNAKTGKHYRLPSEAEWEYACRAGGDGKYCGGENVDALAWHDDNSNKTTHPVGKKQANVWGLYDMSGNVWEWVQDWKHDDYSGAPTDGSAWEDSGEYRVLRGGSWNIITLNLRAACRNLSVPSFRNGDFGFRLARTLP